MASQKASINTDLLNTFIRASGKSKTFLSGKIGISRTYFYKKCNGLIAFDSSEIETLCEEINVNTKNSMMAIFFPNWVDRTSPQ